MYEYYYVANEFLLLSGQWFKQIGNRVFHAKLWYNRLEKELVTSAELQRIAYEILKFQIVQ